MSIKKTSTKLICILAAGIGSRMGEYTEIINKSLLPINFTSSLTKIINSFPKNSKFVIASGFKKENVKNFVKILNNKNIKIVIVKKFTGKVQDQHYHFIAAKNIFKIVFILYLVIHSSPEISQNMRIIIG